jgi:hypothetical protein
MPELRFAKQYILNDVFIALLNNIICLNENPDRP